MPRYPYLPTYELAVKIGKIQNEIKNRQALLLKAQADEKKINAVLKVAGGNAGVAGAAKKQLDEIVKENKANTSFINQITAQLAVYQKQLPVDQAAYDKNMNAQIALRNAFIASIAVHTKAASALAKAAAQPMGGNRAPAAARKLEAQVVKELTPIRVPNPALSTYGFSPADMLAELAPLSTQCFNLNKAFLAITGTI